MTRLRRSAALLVMSSKAPATRRAYATDWRDFARWCESAGRSALPATQDTLKLYIVDQLETRALATVHRRIAAIVDKHSAEKLDSPHGYATKELMHGAARAKGAAQKQKDALAPADLRKMCAALLAKKSRTALRDPPPASRRRRASPWRRRCSPCRSSSGIRGVRRKR